MSCVLIKVFIKGRMGGFYSERWSNPNNTRRQMWKFGWSILILIIMAAVANYYYSSGVKHILAKYKPEHHRHHEEQEQPEETRVEHHHGHHKKHHGHCHIQCLIGPILVVATFIWHFCNYRMKLSALKKLEGLK